jgi:hypothetical protein
LDIILPSSRTATTVTGTKPNQSVNNSHPGGERAAASNKAVEVRLQASNMHHINEAGDVVFTYPLSYSALEIVKEFKKTLNEEPLMQAIYLALHPVPDTFLEGKTLWD